MIRVPTSPQNSSNVCQSRPFRASRDALNREDSADVAFADARQQPFKTWPGNAITGATEIVIDDLNVAPTELLPACDEGVLASLTLKIVGNLMGR